MPKVNLSAFGPQPLEMQFGKWTITSPVPDGRELKAMKGLMAYSAMTSVITEASIANGDDPAEALQGVDVSDDVTALGDMEVTVLALGQAEVDRLEEVGCPAPLVEKAAMYALLYWAAGESTIAANTWLESLENKSSPKAPRPPRRRDQKGKRRRRR